MNQLSTSNTKTFNLLSIGQRGVGKTVFLAGSYVELHSTNQTKHLPQLWFDCQDSQEQEKIEKILSYIAQNRQYPPPTLKITNFNLSLKRQSRRGVQTLCHFRWWDIPGESCNIGNPEFQKIVLSSHGCCVFINAEALIRDQAYLQTLEAMINQVMAIASLVTEHNLNYAFALIFTKCDLIGTEPLTLLQIEEKVQPLVARLEAIKVNYQRFYSSIPIVSHAGTATLKATGAAASLLWLVSELRLHTQQELGVGLTKSQAKSTEKAFAVEKLLRLNLPLTARRKYNLSLIIASICLLGVSGSLLFAFGLFTPAAKQAETPEKRIMREYEQVLQREPDNFDALINLANLYIQQKQPNQAIPLMEKLVQKEPERLDLYLNLAQLYKLTNQPQKAETAYDQILAQENNNLTALINKAVLRNEQGDSETARTLFLQAEKAAPSELKAQIRETAKITLSTTAKSIPDATK